MDDEIDVGNGCTNVWNVLLSELWCRCGVDVVLIVVSDVVLNVVLTWCRRGVECGVDVASIVVLNM